MKRISQQQIAKDLGVSQSLVSIVLNGRREGISENTFTRIWQYAREQGYSPKGMKLEIGNEIRQETGKSIGYFLRAPLKLATTSNFFSHVHQGLYDYAYKHRMQTVFLGSENDFDPKKLGKVAWQTQNLAGIVIMGQVAPSFLLAVRQLGKTLVYVSARSPGVCHSVNSNESLAAELLIDHLTEAGHENFAYFGGTCAKERNAERLQSLTGSLALRGLELPECNIIIYGDAERKEGYQAAEEFLDRDHETLPTAWICVNGLMARGVINYLTQKGCELGKSISVAAFDMTRVCSEEIPGITSAAAVPEDLGREAARIIIDQGKVKDKRLSDITIPAKLVVRESSGPLLELPAKKNIAIR